MALRIPALPATDGREFLEATARVAGVNGEVCEYKTRSN